MPTDGGSHFFSGAIQPNVTNSTFSSVSGDYYNMHYYAPKSERYGLRLLLDNIAKGAFHDAAERGDPLKCHPQTRLAIRKEIMQWVKLPEARRKLILWMYGPAGSGKTAIGQSIAEECKQHGLLSASFFFSRIAHRVGCNDTTRVLATIAYQISRFLPQVEELLFTAIEKDPTIFSRTLGTQMEVLIIEPLRAQILPLKPMFVVLDGIDEIRPNARSQADLLNVVGTAVSALRHIPLIFLIASRPEYEIREAFGRPMLSSFTRPLVLDDKYEPDSDIRLYLDSKFQDIRDEHLRLGANLPSPWPSECDVDQLVLKASGQFIFAATVTKFIDSIRHHPPDQLDIILGLSTPGNATPFALLDALYLHILSSVTDIQIPRVREILTVLIFSDYDSLFSGDATIEMYDKLLGFDVRRALVDMHALIFVPPLTNNGSDLQQLWIHHASLEDFLMNRSRSHDFYINPSVAHLSLTRHWSRAIANYQIAGPLDLHHCLEGFCYHFRGSLPNNSEFTDVLACFNLRQHLEDDACDAIDLQVMPWQDFFECIQMQAGDRRDVFPRLRDEFDAFILENRLSKYPPSLQAYIPTIMTLEHSCQSDVFTILTYDANPLLTEFKESQALDESMLNISERSEYTIDGAFSVLFQDRSRAGRYYVSDRSYIALIKKMIGIIFPKRGEVNQQVKLEAISSDEPTYLYGSDGSLHIRLDEPSFGWLADMLLTTSTDPELAQILHECAYRYQIDAEFMGVWPNIAEASRKYIQKCGIPCLEHANFPESDGTFVIELGGLDSQSSPLVQLSPASELSPCAGEVDDLPDDPAMSHTTFSYPPSQIPTTAVSNPPDTYGISGRYLALPSSPETTPLAESSGSKQKRRAKSPPGGHIGKRSKP